MVAMIDRGLGQLNRIPALPAFVTPEEILADALPLLDPPSRISVTDAAEQSLRVPIAGRWGAYDRGVAPYTIEPQDISQSRRFKGVIFVGPSQSGKSQMLLSVSAHAVTCAPGPVQLIHMTKTDADAWVEEKLNPAIFNSPRLHERLGRSREDSTFSRKRFKGMRLTIGYPVANQLSSRSQRGVLLTDYDHMPQRLGPKDAPEDSPFGMALRRIKTFLSRGFVFVESTPAFPVDEDKFRAASLLEPHLMPATTGGIVNLYNQGTRGRWYWECPDCENLFEPTFERLDYNRDLDPADAGDAAAMVCPHCGSVIPHRHKAELNRHAATSHGGWLHEGRAVDEETGARRLVRIDDPELRNAPFASYAFNGAAAAFSSWASLVERYESARRSFEVDGDDQDFAGVHYTEIGVPYRRSSLEDEDALTLETLREHALQIEKGIAPSWTRFITVMVDVQGNRFEVMAMAWGAEGERVALERYAIHQPPDDAPSAKGDDGRYRAIDPGRYAEDATVLSELADRVYPVDGADWGLMPIAVVIDFNGPKGWSDNAEKFWRQQARAGRGGRFYLSIGRPGFNQRDRVWHEAPDRASRGKKARGIRLLNMAVDRLKDSVVAALGRLDTPIGAQHIPSWMGAEHVSEHLAEARGEKGWALKKGVQRNEGLDHSVQALALAEHLGVNRVNWEAPPAWCLAGLLNPNAVRLDRANDAASAHERSEPRMPRKINFLRR
ncbi:phage terminase large subunit family protein [Paracoccus sp. R12_1]|uniref:terminase gpA endonuclease subunit n=1 Tax=unclassified Paracoccus (in: a-proteobacteria) TaxID=2688777 RepID=UPI001AD9F21E|nr:MULTISPECIES: terminase gpA endonuclease subunit [unclassified Paracoccus (in: a-proteobacteria)]MBO9457349.1 phage terminase large subunit family protein [Paracoccus sp. R12_2]MBO9488647.1 phage terminase large subunit family protein [Paracoccus sp. R12_1]